MTSSYEAFAVIMAGGRGERFWPESRISRPKQLLRLFGRRTLLEETVARLDGLFDPSHIIIVTNGEYADSVRELLPQLPHDNVIGEPALRDTAPCIAMASAYIGSIAKDDVKSIMCVLPADHVVNDVDGFRKVISECVDHAAGNDDIVTVGMIPDYPATGYGYIETGDKICESFTSFYKALAFREKPDSETASRYVSSGSFKWNGGMFIMSLDTINSAFASNAPELDEFRRKLEDIFSGVSTETLSQAYSNVKRISIDYAVMEKADNIVLAESRFDWDDAGSWMTLRNQLEADSNGNVSKGLFLSLDTKNCIVSSTEDHLVAAIGVEELALIHTDDATLVCPLSELQRIKDIIKVMSDDPALKKYL